MIDVYRADHREIPEEPGDTGVPVRVVWGRNDAFFPPGAAALTEEIVGPDAFLEVPDATHWILLEEPELTGLEMVRFFGS
jgi:pimeloyl-ACP methyl ester carboxylesterase